jgi:hypothetical protein
VHELIGKKVVIWSSALSQGQGNFKVLGLGEGLIKLNDLDNGAVYWMSTAFIRYMHLA